MPDTHELRRSAHPAFKLRGRGRLIIPSPIPSNFASNTSIFCLPLYDARVIHCAFSSRLPGVSEFNDEAVLIVLRRILSREACEALASGVDDVEITVGTVIPA